jgi:uncharacterized membrane protein
MSDLVAIVYPSEAKAEEVRQRLFDLKKQYLIEFSDAVIAVKTNAGLGRRVRRAWRGAYGLWYQRCIHEGARGQS